jgi:uncharacterized protein
MPAISTSTSLSGLSDELCAPTDWMVAASLTPITDGELAPFYAAAAQGELVMPFCGICEWAALELEQTTCDTCGAQDVQWRTIDLFGIVHSATTVHRLEPGLVLTSEPYQIIDVEFASTHRLLMTTTEPVAEPFPIDTPVTIGFRVVGGVAVPAVSGFNTAITDPLDEGFGGVSASVGQSVGTVQLLGATQNMSANFSKPLVTISSDDVPGGTR